MTALRRMVTSLRARDWTASAIELAIVVFGVFLGVQVSNWNEDRVDRIRSHQYLERIRADLQADLSNYRDRSGFWQSVSGKGRSALAYVEGSKPDGVDHWPVLLAFFQASQIAEFYTTSTTYDELKSAGELGLIRSLALRDSLATYYTNADNASLSERPAYRTHLRGRLPLEVQDYIWANCYRSTANGTQQLQACQSPISEAEARVLVQQLASDTALIEEMRYWMSTLSVASLIGQDRVALASEIIEQVEDELDGGK